MKLMKLRKAMEHRSKYLPLFGELQKNIILKKYQKKRQLKNENKINYFQNFIEPEKILPKKLVQKF